MSDLQENVGKIYIIRNTVNDKVYIGQTIHTLQTRFRQHQKCAKNNDSRFRKICCAMNKYGADNFYIELIQDNIPLENLDEKEIYYIKQYNSYENGYNATAGGDSRIIYNDDDIVKLKQMLKDKVPYPDIAKEFNVTAITIQRIAHSFGIKRNLTISKEYLLNNYDKTNIEIAKEFGVNGATVTRAFQRYGIKRGRGVNNHKMPQNQGKKVDDVEYLAYRLTHTKCETFEHFGISRFIVEREDKYLFGNARKKIKNDCFRLLHLLYERHKDIYEHFMKYENNGATYREAMRKVLAVNGLYLPDEKPKTLFD